MRNTGLAAITNLLISTNKGSEATEVLCPPNALFECTDAIAYL